MKYRYLLNRCDILDLIVKCQEKEGVKIPGKPGCGLKWYYKAPSEKDNNIMEKDVHYLNWFGFFICTRYVNCNYILFVPTSE